MNKEEFKNIVSNLKEVATDDSVGIHKNLDAMELILNCYKCLIDDNGSEMSRKHLEKDLRAFKVNA